MGMEFDGTITQGVGSLYRRTHKAVMPNGTGFIKTFRDNLARKSNFTLIMETAGDVLVVSQFTLFASYKKGNRPSWFRAAQHEISIPLYKQFCQQLSKELGKPVQTGEFGADMKVALVNDGPVTICMDTKNKE